VRLDDENVSAADLPEDGWIKLAGDCAARGEYRFALRALFLANLSYLGRRELVTLAPFKSNRDYYRELRRRARNEAVPAQFSQNVLAFERGWYGSHAVDAEQVGEFETVFARIREFADA
jgi:hypothetical protein